MYYLNSPGIVFHWHSKNSGHSETHVRTQEMSKTIMDRQTCLPAWEISIQSFTAEMHTSPIQCLSVCTSLQAPSFLFPSSGSAELYVANQISPTLHRQIFTELSQKAHRLPGSMVYMRKATPAPVLQTCSHTETLHSVQRL